MTKKPNLSTTSKMDIPNYAIERIARCILPMIQQYYESEEGQQELKTWQEPNTKPKRKWKGREVDHSASRLLHIHFNVRDKNDKSEPFPYRDQVRISQVWWSIGDSNSWPSHCERDALPTVPMPQIFRSWIFNATATQIKPIISLNPPSYATQVNADDNIMK